MLDKKGVAALNLISSPGAGKTTLLEQTIARLKGKLTVGVIEGDLYTARDAGRISAQGAAAVQINTGGTCHLNAAMVARALEELPLASLDLLFIENVGNLVCPAAFYLGEHCKVALLSVAEGSDKPAKYPGVFREARAVVVTKLDLLPYTDFDLAGCTAELKELNPELNIFVLSAKTGAGMEGWLAWLTGFKLIKGEAPPKLLARDPAAGPKPERKGGVVDVPSYSGPGGGSPGRQAVGSR